MMKAICLGFVLVTSFASAQNLYQFSIDGYPKTSPDCKVTAQEVAQQFAKGSGVTITGVKCRKINLHSYDLQIFYSGQTESKVVSNDKWAIYPNLKSCEESLAKEKEFFETTTGLASVLSYCAEDTDPANNADGSVRFDPTLYAVGEPRSVIRSLALNIFEGGYLGTQKELQEILEKTKSKNLNMVQIVLQEKKVNATLWMRFVLPPNQAEKDLGREFHLKTHVESIFSATTSIDLDADPMIGLTPEQCEHQKNYAEKTFNSKLGAPTVWFCMWDKILYHSRLYHLRIDKSDSSFARIFPGKDGQPFANEYVSHEACEQDQSNVIGYYQEKLGYKEMEGLCSWKLHQNDPVQLFLYYIDPDLKRYFSPIKSSTHSEWGVELGKVNSTG